MEERRTEVADVWKGEHVEEKGGGLALNLDRWGRNGSFMFKKLGWRKLLRK